MAIFHYTIKIVGRSKGKSVISASAYLNGDVMKNEETGSISYYTSKKEVVYTSLMMCENAPSEWQIVPEENIKRFQKSVRYKRSEDKEAAIKKFKITFQKQRLWNEVLKIEKSADAQLGRSFEFALPKEWSRQEQIQYTADYIQKTFVDKGMCADWSIHDNLFLRQLFFNSGFLDFASNIMLHATIPPCTFIVGKTLTIVYKIALTSLIMRVKILLHLPVE